MEYFTDTRIMNCNLTPFRIANEIFLHLANSYLLSIFDCPAEFCPCPEYRLSTFSRL